MEAFKLKMTSPVDGESEIFSSPAPDDPARVQSKIKVETADEYCYQVIAVREGAADSAPSEQECVTTTLPAEAPPGPTESPTIVPIAPPTDGESGGSSSPPSPTPTSADPLPSIAVLQLLPGRRRVDDEAGPGRGRTRRLADLGITAKVLFSQDWTFSTPLQPSYLLYVDGPTAADAKAACDAVVAAAPDSVPDNCLPLTVTGKAPSG